MLLTNLVTIPLRWAVKPHLALIAVDGKDFSIVRWAKLRDWRNRGRHVLIVVLRRILENCRQRSLDTVRFGADEQRASCSLRLTDGTLCGAS